MPASQAVTDSNFGAELSEEDASRSALYRLLGPFAKHGINLTRIESRPSQRRKWDYVFFLDAEGHMADDKLSQALAELKDQASLFRVLGSYPQAVL